MDSSAQSWRGKLTPWFTISVAFFIVAFGQPAWVPWLGLVAGICGYALFWKGMLAFRRQRDRFWLSTIWYSMVQAVQLSWLTSDEYHGLYTWFVWLFFAFALGLQFGVLSFFIRPAIRLTVLRTLAVPAVWTVIEWLRLYFTSGFTWNPAGLAITGYAVPAQLAAVLGIYGLSFWVMLVNVLFLQLFLVHRERKRWAWAFSMALLPYLFGLAHIGFHTHQMRKNDREPISVILVQTGLHPKHKQPLGSGPIEVIHPLVQWARIVNLLSVHDGKPVDFIVMPEGTVPFLASQLAYSYDAAQEVLRSILGKKYAVPEDSRLVNRVSHGHLKAVSNRFFCAALAEHFNANVIVGLEDCNEERNEYYTSALNFRPGTLETERHNKRILLPIAEHIPYEWLVAVAKQYGIEGTITPGQNATLFSGSIPIGATICYEETFSGVVRDTRRAGAEMFVNLTADGWYPNTRLPMQHFTHGRVRAIENGVPLVRSCHTGITVAVDCLGRTVAQLGDDLGRPESLAAALYAQVPRYHYKTLYSLVGDGFAVGTSWMIVIFYFVHGLFKR